MGDAPKRGSKASQDRKIFIGGLNYNTTEDGLKEHFSKFGEIVDVVVMKFPDTKRSRGFGFVTFSEAPSVDACQNARPHIIDEKEVETKRATPKDESRHQPGSVKKIFVGGLKDEHNNDEIQRYFSEFGNVVNVTRLTEKDTGKKRGFGFVEFDDYDPVDKVILKGNHEINGLHVDVKKAVSKQEVNSLGGPQAMKMSRMANPPRGGRRGGGMRGGILRGRDMHRRGRMDRGHGFGNRRFGGERIGAEAGWPKTAPVANQWDDGLGGAPDGSWGVPPPTHPQAPPINHPMGWGGQDDWNGGSTGAWSNSPYPAGGPDDRLDQAPVGFSSSFGGGRGGGFTTQVSVRGGSEGGGPVRQTMGGGYRTAPYNAQMGGSGRGRGRGRGRGFRR